jgi:hypothetical protein
MNRKKTHTRPLTTAEWWYAIGVRTKVVKHKPKGASHERRATSV